MKNAVLLMKGLVAFGGFAEAKQFSGVSGGSWFEAGNWAPNGVPSADDDVTIPAGIVVRADGVPTAKSLAIADGAGLSIFGANAVYTESVQFENYSTHTANGYGRIAIDATTADAIGLSVVGDVTVSGTGWLAVGGFSQACAASVTIGGDLTLSGTAKVSVYAGPGTPKTTGSTLSVTGALTVGAGTMLELNNHIGVHNYGVAGTAAHVGIAAGTFKVEAGGMVRSVVGCNDYCEGAAAMGTLGRGSNPDYAASGHGGAGGWGKSTITSTQEVAGGGTYDWELAPQMPGRHGRYITVGGGVIDLNAGMVKIEGLVDVSSVVLLKEWERGAGAGGSIWITCESFLLSGTGCLKARGMNGLNYSNKMSGSGGGGRIAVGIGLSVAAREELRTTGATEHMTSTFSLVERYGSACVNAEAGTPVSGAGCGEPGTAVMYYGKESGQRVVVTTAAPEASAAKLPTDVFMVLKVADGGLFSETIGQYYYLDADEKVRLEIKGWQLVSTEGAVLASGSGCTASLPSLNVDATLIWQVSDEEYRIDIASFGGGEVPSVAWCERGETTTIEPTDTTGFIRWVDDENYLQGDTGATNYTVTVLKPVSLVALYEGFVPTDKTYVGVKGGDWDGPTNWDPAGVPGYGDAVSIPAGTVVGARGSIKAGSLSVGEGATLSVFGAVNDFATASLTFGRVSTSVDGVKLANVGRLAYDATATEMVSVGVLGAISLGTNARFAVGGLDQSAPALVGAGSLTVANGAKMSVYPGALDNVLTTLRSGGARVVVAGRLLVESGGELVLHGHLTKGTANVPSAAVAIDAGEFAVEAGATVSAHTGAGMYTKLPGGGTDGNFTGAGHGGVGGNGGRGALGNGSTCGMAYDEPFAPRYPGANGRYNCNFGGGEIRVRTGLLTLAGTLDASSTICNQSNWEQGGGAGGSVFIVAGKTDIADTAEVLSNGMNGKSNNTSYLNGGGAGGRISLVVNAPAEAIESLWETGDWVNDRFTKTDLVANPGSFAGTVSVAGGIGANNGTAGGVGTAYLCEYLDASVAMVTIESDCADADGTLFDPPLAAQQMEAGKPFAATAPTEIAITADGSVRRLCTGYTLYDAVGEEVETVADVHEFSLDTLEGNIRLVWHFGAEQHRLDTDGGVAWKAVGESVTLTAPDVGFKGWLFSGPASPEALRGGSLTFAMNAPYRAYALDGTAGAPLQDRTFVGEDGGWWHDPANWSPAGEPTLGDNVIVPEGKTVNVFATGVAGALQVGEGATVSVFGATTALYACVDIPHLGTGDQFVAERSRIGRHAADFARHLAPSLLVKGDMTVAAGASVAVGGLWQVEGSVLQVGGNLTLAGAATKLHVYAASTNGVSLTEATAGGRVTVFGTMTVGDGVTVEVYDAAGRFANDVRLGWVAFDLGSLVVAEGGTLKAAFGGCSSVKDTYQISQADSQVGGTGHGGRGGSGYGNGMSSAGGKTYDDPYYPRLPGQFSRGGDTFGGGVLAIAAKSVTVNGRIAADAERIISNYEHGGAAGGTVRIVTDDIVFGESGLVSANGHDAWYGTGSTYHTGGGGGGRISVIVGFSPAKLAGLAAGNEKIITRRMVAQDQTEPDAKYAGHFSVAGGLNSHGDDKGGTDGETGTAFVIYSRDPGLQILIK